jgi:hypothetical protein
MSGSDDRTVALWDACALVLVKGRNSANVCFVAPAAIRGGLPEIGGFATVVVAMLSRRRDLLPALAGVVMLASLRYFQR